MFLNHHFLRIVKDRWPKTILEFRKLFFPPDILSLFDYTKESRSCHFKSNFSRTCNFRPRLEILNAQMLSLNSLFLTNIENKWWSLVMLILPCSMRLGLFNVKMSVSYAKMPKHWFRNWEFFRYEDVWPEPPDKYWGIFLDWRFKCIQLINLSEHTLGHPCGLNVFGNPCPLLDTRSLGAKLECTLTLTYIHYHTHTQPH